MSENQEDIIKLASKTAIEQYKKEQDKNKKCRADRRLKNTKLLLSNYRSFAECAKNSISEAKQIEGAEDFLDLMWDPNNNHDLQVEAIKKSAIKTNIMVKHIDAMLQAFMEICYNSHNELDRRRYDILYDRYINEESISIDEIANKYYVDRRTVYNDIDFAIKCMAKLIFGVDYIMNDGQ